MSLSTILVLDDFAGLGGAQRVLIDWLARLDRDRWRPIPVGPTGGRMEDEVQAAGLELQELDLYARKRDWYRVWPVLTAQAAIRRLSRRFQPDLIHVNSLWALQFAGPAAARLGLPVVATIHAFPEPRSPAKRLLLGAALRRAMGPVRGVAAVSRVLAEALDRSGVPQRLLRVIPNGVDLERFHPAIPIGEVRAELGLQEEDVAVLLPGRVHPGKGHRVLLEAARLLRDREPRLWYLVVGEEIETPLEQLRFAQALTREAEQAGLGDRFRLLGYRRDLPALMAAADIVCLPSFQETFGMVILESMAVETAVVASRVGGLPELVEEGRTGLLVPPGDPDALAGALAELAADPDRRRRMGQAAGEEVRLRFRLEETVAALEELYRDALEPGR